MTTSGPNDAPVVGRLAVDECWRLLGTHSSGRVCFCVDDRVEVVLTGYVVRPRRIYFRAVAFGRLTRRVFTRPVTLEVDDQQGTEHATWLVTATGSAQHVESAATLASLWMPVRPGPWEVGQESLWVELTPDDVQGHRIS